MEVSHRATVAILLTPPPDAPGIRIADVQEEAERKKREKRNRRRTIVMDSDGDQKGVMDELIASLKTGEAFTRACVSLL